MIRAILFISTILCTTHLFGQQYPIISNYLTAHYGFNPAATGTISNSHLHLLYRTQWIGFEQAPTTQIAAYRTRLNRSPLALGGFLFNDEAGVFQRSGAMALASYTHQLEEAIFLSFGLSAGYQNLRLSNNFFTQDQVDNALLEASNGSWHPDLNAGVFLNLKDLYLGFSSPQLLGNPIQLNQSENLNRLQRHYYILMGYRFQVSEFLGVEPSTLIKVAQGTSPQIDASLKMTFYNKFWLGTTYRTEDAIVALAGFNFAKKFDLSYAYDLTTSDLRNVSSGSHEISLGFRFGGNRDKDGDGIVDHLDQCPDQAGPERLDGCPEDIFTKLEQLDTDADGTVDNLDPCPNEWGPRENNGCPWSDKDEDGIRDEEDACPEIAGVTLNQGCPMDDRDKDGVRDAVDQCPDVAGSFITKGCPDMDTDKDGLRDPYDNCPYTFGPPNNGGCPIVTPRETDLLDKVSKNLYFNTGDFELLAASQLQLIELTSLLKERADWQLKITGHTDNKGSALTNLEISRKRAEAVKAFLVSQGIPGDQILVEYYGESRPIADNDSEYNRKKNRRVELEFVFD